MVRYILYMAGCCMPLTRQVFSIMVKGGVKKFQLTTPFTDDPILQMDVEFPKTP